MRLPSLTRLTSRLALAVALAAAVALPLAPRSMPVASAAGDCTIDATLDADEQQFLTLINNHRAQNGLGPLKISYTLTRASAWKSQDMAANAYFAHDDPGRTWIQRVRDCGYGFNAYIGENIAAGYGDAQAVFDGWKNSPGHNANMLGANYTTIGIGKAVLPGSPYGTYWTTDFGSFSDGWVTATDNGTTPIATPTPVASPTPTDATPPTRHRLRKTPTVPLTQPSTGADKTPWWRRFHR
jgi:uncharacterized protein YkwD